MPYIIALCVTFLKWQNSFQKRIDIQNFHIIQPTFCRSVMKQGQGLRLSDRNWIRGSDTYTKRDCLSFLTRLSHFLLGLVEVDSLWFHSSSLIPNVYLDKVLRKLITLEIQICRAESINVYSFMIKFDIVSFTVYQVTHVS